jgi:hypothetical protein
MNERINSQTPPQLVKVAITAEADKILVAMVSKTNEGSTSGRVGKRDLASWIIRHFSEMSFTRSLEEIRTDHFDEIVYLNNSLKSLGMAKRNGISQDEVNKLAYQVIRNLPKPKTPHLSKEVNCSTTSPS